MGYFYIPTDLVHASGRGDGEVLFFQLIGRVPRPYTRQHERGLSSTVREIIEDPDSVSNRKDGRR